LEKSGLGKKLRTRGGKIRENPIKFMLDSKT
jgi:hypothetical protein